MSIILGIETATKMCSVAISKDGELMAIKEQGGAYSHAENLNNFIAEVVEKAGITLNDIDVIAVSKGPGSYTGLRIGVSTAKGLCYSLNKPLISADTLKVLAKSITENNVLVRPMIDARRMEVYTAAYDSASTEVAPIEAKIVDETSFADELANNKVVFLGDGAEKCKEVLGAHPNAIFIDDKHPSAKELNALALEKLKANELENVAYFEPFYLKDFVATTPKKLL